LVHSKSAGISITDIKYRLDINTGAHLATKALALNEIATVNVSFDRPVPFAPYHDNRRLGAFIVIDKLTNETVGAGMIHFALRRAVNVHWQALEVTKVARAEAQTPAGALSLVDRAVRFGQVDDRQSVGKALARRREAHLYP
jgi:bifunctional enzyme CysN/CysC